ncbi:MAG: SpoIIE family protein phosphatase [Deltaproteobacteria bacterium]|nr:SpoIIE family protein phosphatase [Deltaproteobacteria bacterium]
MSDVNGRRYSGSDHKKSIMYADFFKNPHCLYGARMRSCSENDIDFESGYELIPGTVLHIRRANYKIDSVQPQEEMPNWVRVVSCRKLTDGGPFGYSVCAEKISPPHRSMQEKDNLVLRFPDLTKPLSVASDLETLETDCENPACRSVQGQLRFAKEMAEKRAKELATLNRFAMAIGSTLDLKQILKIICIEMVDIFGSRNAGIGLLNAQRTQLTLVAFHTISDDEPDATGLVIPTEGNAATIFVIEHGETIIVPDAQHNPITASYHDIAFLRGTHCIMIVPLLSRGEVIGTIGLPTMAPDRIFSPSDVSFAQTIAAQISGAIENARLYEKTEKARGAMEQELKIGRDIQYGFFPKTLPSIRGWEVVSHFRPARMVAGDFYDMFILQENHMIGFVIADVCGKGVGSALYMALFRTLIRAFAINRITEASSSKTASLPLAEEILTRSMEMTNQYIACTHSSANMFATVFMGILKPQTGMLSYLNAGHPPPVVVGRDGIKTSLEATGTVVGMLPNYRFDVSCIQLKPGDTLFAYTDGLTEAKSPKGVFFGTNRLQHRLSRQFKSAQQMVDQILAEIERHTLGAEQSDDITVLALRRTGRL